jgi:hypothetical protein
MFLLYYRLIHDIFWVLQVFKIFLVFILGVQKRVRCDLNEDYRKEKKKDGK